ncbi:MAG: hypothetical protein IT463_04280, partial [Planctomycetes bacterium]|nr:hypothetical protein [Planctomycetota bacterium]
MPQTALVPATEQQVAKVVEAGSPAVPATAKPPAGSDAKAVPPKTTQRVPTDGAPIKATAKLAAKAAAGVLPGAAKAAIVAAGTIGASILVAVTAIALSGGGGNLPAPVPEVKPPSSLGPGLGDLGAPPAGAAAARNGLPFPTGDALYRSLTAFRVKAQEDADPGRLYRHAAEDAAVYVPPTPPAQTTPANPQGGTVQPAGGDRREAFVPEAAPGPGRGWTDYFTLLRNALDLPAAAEPNLEHCWLLLQQVVDPACDTRPLRAEIARHRALLHDDLRAAADGDAAARVLAAFLLREFRVAGGADAPALPAEMLLTGERPARASRSALNFYALVLAHDTAAMPAFALLPTGSLLRVQDRNLDLAEGAAFRPDEHYAAAIPAAELAGGRYLVPVNGRAALARLLAELAPRLEAERAVPLLRDVALDASIPSRGDPASTLGWLTLAKLLAGPGLAADEPALRQALLAGAPLPDTKAATLEPALQALSAALADGAGNPHALLLRARCRLLAGDAQAARSDLVALSAREAELPAGDRNFVAETAVLADLALRDDAAALANLLTLIEQAPSRRAELAPLHDRLCLRRALRLLRPGEDAATRYAAWEWLAPRLQLDPTGLETLLAVAALVDDGTNLPLEWQMVAALRRLTGQDFSRDA